MNHFQKIEYSETFKHFWGRKAFVFSHVTFYCCITCLNIASIVDTAQVVDQMLSRYLKGGAIALSLSREGGEEQVGSGGEGNDLESVIMEGIMSTNDSVNAFMGQEHSLFHDTSKSWINWTLVRWNRSACYVDNDDDDDDIIAGGGSANVGAAEDDDDIDYDCLPFQTTMPSQVSLLVTLGYILAAICFLPMSLQDLKVCFIIDLFSTIRCITYMYYRVLFNILLVDSYPSNMDDVHCFQFAKQL